MKVKEVMHKGVAWIEPEQSVGEVAKMMRNEDVGAIPVGENDRLIGMVTDRDIVMRGIATGSDFKEQQARDVMSEPITYCHEDEDIEDAVRLMEDKQIRRLPVINKKKRMVGMVSIGDIAAKTNSALCSETMRAVSAHHA